MEAAGIFRIVGTVVLPGWLLLILAPRLAFHDAGGGSGLAFDLFIGAWEVRDAQKHQVPHLAFVPCLLLTFLFGPVGLLLYFILRYAIRRQLSL